jgi:hypothetical protein
LTHNCGAVSGPHGDKKDIHTIFPQANDDAADLLRRLLVFDPDQRMTAAQALEHPYVAHFHDKSNEPRCSRPIMIPINDNEKVRRGCSSSRCGCSTLRPCASPRVVLMWYDECSLFLGRLSAAQTHATLSVVELCMSAVCCGVQRGIQEYRNQLYEEIVKRKKALRRQQRDTLQAQSQPAAAGPPEQYGAPSAQHAPAPSHGYGGHGSAPAAQAAAYGQHDPWYGHAAPQDYYSSHAAPPPQQQQQAYDPRAYQQAQQAAAQGHGRQPRRADAVAASHYDPRDRQAAAAAAAQAQEQQGYAAMDSQAYSDMTRMRSRHVDTRGYNNWPSEAPPQTGAQRWAPEPGAIDNLNRKFKHGVAVEPDR